MFQAGQLRALFQDDVFAEVSRYDPWAASLAALESKGDDWLSAAQYSDLESYLPLDILTKVDRMTMAHSIEARPPLLDHKLVEFAATVPAHMRLHNGTTKYLLKQAMRGVLPDGIIDRYASLRARPIS